MSFSDAGQAPSLVGQRPRTVRGADQYQWIRPCLAYLHRREEEYETLADMLGPHGAAEVLLLALARSCNKNPTHWEIAKNCGIPWQQKSFSGLARLQGIYNGGVASGSVDASLQAGQQATPDESTPLERIPEDTVTVQEGWDVVNTDVVVGADLSVSSQQGPIVRADTSVSVGSLRGAEPTPGAVVGTGNASSANLSASASVSPVDGTGAYTPQPGLSIPPGLARRSPGPRRRQKYITRLRA